MEWRLCQLAESRKCMVRRRTAGEKRRVDRQICANVFGLWWRAQSPGHDELRCVLFLINGTVIADHFREQVSSTPLELFDRLSCPVQTLVGTLNSRRRGAVKWERDFALPS
jgi:hypothetical protein